MAKRSRMSILKRQRELKKSEKAAKKRAKKHGLQAPTGSLEPGPTQGIAELLGLRLLSDDDEPETEQADEEQAEVADEEQAEHADKP